MKNANKCPKCDSKEIYTDEGQKKRGEPETIAISNWSRLFIDTYICTNCGFTEEYVRQSDLKDSKKMEKLKESYKKKIL